MVIFPPSKINLGLSVTAKRSDGFHNVETVLYPIPLRDVLEIIPAHDRFRFSTSGIAVTGTTEENLVVKAYRMLQKSHGVGPVSLHLHKAIPAGAGLGGGSADAAYVFLLLDTMFDLGLLPGKMEEMAGRLGSDCPFFIRNEPRLALGRGDRFEPVDVNLDGHSLLLVKPPVHINTARAYSWITPREKDLPVKEIVRLPVSDWNSLLVNDFERPVFERFGELAAIKEKIIGMGAAYAAMTGSGSAIYGLFTTEIPPNARDHFPGCFVWHSKLTRSG